MLELWSNIVCLLNAMSQTLYSYMVDAGEFIIDMFLAVINGVLSFLPEDPRSSDGVESEILEVFNYIVPMQTITFSFMAILALWIIYRALQWALAWGKADF